MDHLDAQDANLKQLIPGFNVMENKINVAEDGTATEAFV